MYRDTSEELINRLEARCDLLRSKTLESDDEFDDWILTQYWLESNVAKCLNDCRQAIMATNLGIRAFLDRYTWYDYYYIIPYWMSHYGGAVTWESICEAWMKDDFDGAAPTIAFIDRMRQLIWNEPFYVAWAAKPEQQEL